MRKIRAKGFCVLRRPSFIFCQLLLRSALGTWAPAAETEKPKAKRARVLGRQSFIGSSYSPPGRQASLRRLRGSRSTMSGRGDGPSDRKAGAPAFSLMPHSAVRARLLALSSAISSSFSAPAPQSSARCDQHAALRLTRRSLCAQALATPSRAAATSAARVAAAGAAAAAGVVAGGAKVRSNCRRRQPAPLRCPTDRAMAGALTGRGRGEGRERTPVSRAALRSRLAGRKTDTVCAEPVRGLPVRAQRAACPGRGRERRHAGHARQPLGCLGPPHILLLFAAVPL